MSYEEMIETIKEVHGKETAKETKNLIEDEM
jgi:hypothetical protein